MCFSATASFGAGIILSAVGVASIKRAQSRSQLFFANIPMVFAVQQIAEGFLWMAVTNSVYSSLQIPTTYVYLFFAQVLWPVWVPLSMLMLVKEPRSLLIQKILVSIGVLISIYLAYCLLTYHVEVKIVEHHLSYIQDYPVMLRRIGGVFYITATIFPPLFTQIKKMWTISAAILISYVITLIFYKNYIVSVWCFFAAIISISILGMMYEITQIDKEKITKVV